MACLPECGFTSFADVKARLAGEGVDVSHLPDMPPEAGFLECVDGCPDLQADLEYANQLGERLRRDLAKD